MPATGSTSLDVILRRTGLSDELLRSAGVRPPSPGAGAPASAISLSPAEASVTPQTAQANGTAQTLPKRPAAPPKPSQGRETGSTAHEPRDRPQPAKPGTTAKSPERVAPRSPAQREPKPAVALSDFIEDRRPKIQLAGDNRLLSDMAADLGRCLADVLFVHNREVVEYRDNLLVPTAPQRFRTSIEKHVRCYRQNAPNGRVIEIDATLSEADARGVLASPFFIERLRPLRHLNTIKVPIIRSNGSVELLPKGYDAETATFTDAQVDYREDMPFADAVAVIRDLFREFRFADGARSLAVAVSALVGLYAKQLIPIGELRPAFCYLKNAEGSGATTCAACAIVPLLGALPIGSKAKDDDEMRKSLTSAIRTGQEVIFLDNLKGQLNSPALEAFTSAPTWTDRLLGTNEVVTGPNTVTTFITANGLSISPDWRRRSLFIELHLSEERAEDRVFIRPLSVPVLQSMRARILGACWSLVRHWDAMGRPQPTRSHSAFPAWAATIGGIVEVAGFGCPFETANVAIVADEDGQGMRTLTAAMTPSALYTSGELVALCRTHGVFDGLVGSSDSDFARPQRSAFGKLLARYHDRLVGRARFVIEGSGHAKRFRVIRADDAEEKIVRISPLEKTTTPNDFTPRKGSYTEGAL